MSQVPFFSELLASRIQKDNTVLMNLDGEGHRPRGSSYLLVFAAGAISVMGIQQLWKATLLCTDQFPLLNPDIACEDDSEKISEWEYEPLRQQLIQAVEGYTSSGKIPYIALYFRDLKQGSRFSIREDEIFTAASLLKLPIMMVLLHQADRQPGLLDEMLTYKNEYPNDVNAEESGEPLQLNHSYSVRELLERMIEFSDNRATYVLLEKINGLKLQENSNTFSDFGTLKLLQSGELDNARLISIVNIFVALYNSSYLSKDLSQFALELLTRTNFELGIVKGVPSNIQIAHKFGVRSGSDMNNELHDCGIVYHPTAPYVLCVLTEGTDITTASSAIAEISRIVYENVDSIAY